MNRIVAIWLFGIGGAMVAGLLVSFTMGVARFQPVYDEGGTLVGTEPSEAHTRFARMQIALGVAEELLLSQELCW